MLAEKEIIDKYFRKLSQGRDHFALTGDCGLITNHNDQQLYNIDTIVEDIHFFANDPSSSIAYKLLAVTLSDIATCGGIPLYWSFSCGFSGKFNYKDQWFIDFAEMLWQLQQQYNFELIAGDTIKVPHSMVFTANIVAKLSNANSPLLGNNAQVGDIICVSSVVGDSYGGLQVLSNASVRGKLSIDDVKYLIHRYHYPPINLRLGEYLAKVANSCTDVSDGLFTDLCKLCRLSNVMGVIDIKNIPYSKAMKNYFHNTDIDQLTIMLKSCAVSDDYNLVFTISPPVLAKLQKHDEEFAEYQQYFIPIGYIASCQEHKYLQIKHDNQDISNFDYMGYQHYFA